MPIGIIQSKKSKSEDLLTIQCKRNAAYKRSSIA